MWTVLSRHIFFCFPKRFHDVVCSTVPSNKPDIYLEVTWKSANLFLQQTIYLFSYGHIKRTKMFVVALFPSDSVWFSWIVTSFETFVHHKHFRHTLYSYRAHVFSTLIFLPSRHYLLFDFFTFDWHSIFDVPTLVLREWIAVGWTSSTLAPQIPART